MEDLQGDRNQPVYLLDELVQPDARRRATCKTVKQDGQRVILTGYAQSQERVAELLRNLSSQSPWLEQPDLIEVRAATVTPEQERAQGRRIHAGRVASSAPATAMRA